MKNKLQLRKTIGKIKINTKSSFRRAVYTLFALFATSFVLGSMILREKDVLLSQTWTINWTALGISFALYTAALFLATETWIKIINRLAIKVSFAKHFRHYCMSLLARRLPGTIWYIAYRAEAYNSEGISRKVTSLASGIEYAVGIISGVIVGSFFSISILRQYPQGVVIIGLLLVISLTILHPKILNWLFKKFTGEELYYKYTTVLQWVVIHIFTRIIGGILIFFIARTLYTVPDNFLPYFIGGWAVVGTLANALIFLPTNFGFTEISFSLLLSNIMPSSIAALIAIMIRIIITIFEVIWALIVFIWDLQIKKQINQKELLSD